MNEKSNGSLLLMGFVGVALLIGGLMVFGVFDLPTVEQVSSAEASTKTATDDQLTIFALILVVVVGAVVSMGVGLAFLIWLLNREGAKMAIQPDNPFEFSLKPEGNSIGTLVRKNSLAVSIGLGIGLFATFVVIALLVGAL